MILRFATVFLLLGGVAPPITPVSGLDIAIDPGRFQLMKDALSWMTFRRDGQLASAEDVDKALLPHLKNRYSNSKFYRTFVIAFQQGVLPKMTLNEGDACEPNKHVWKWRSPMNDSVTWVAIRNFTFTSYRERRDDSLQYCDYRQGLVCNPKTTKCQCREGSSMSPVEPGSSVRRCLLNENEFCALTDFEQARGPAKFKAHLLTEMVFNPMKPEGCQQGLLCRMTQTEPFTPRCYHPSTDPSKWLYDKQSPSLVFTVTPGFGDSCALDLITQEGACGRTPRDLGKAPGLTCFNLGPPRSMANWKDVAVNRVGFCFFELGPWQFRTLASASIPISYLRLWSNNFVMGFVHPRTVPLKRDELEAYYKRFLAEVHDNIFDQYYSVGQLVLKAGGNCNVVKTEKMADIWKFYAGLEEDPPPGQDFVATATKKNLDDKLQELVDLVNLNDGGICKVYWHYHTDDPTGLYPYLVKRAEPLPPLKCVKSGTPTGNNDGICQNVSDVSTKPFAEKIQQLAEYAIDSWEFTQNDETQYDKDILLTNPEPPCIPKNGTSKRSLESLEDGSCPGNSVCLLNYKDYQDIYDSICFVYPHVQLRYDCQDISDPGRTGRCEGRQLTREIQKQVKLMATLAKLGRGEGCRHDWEEQLREGYKNYDYSGNKFTILIDLTRENSEDPGNFCDRRRLLECTEQNRCDCVWGTGPRTTTVDGVDYQSDYCYMKRGSCKELKDLVNKMRLTKEETEAIWKHYGTPDEYCFDNVNVCVFQTSSWCTETNTGETGHDLKPRPKPTTTSTTSTELPVRVKLPPPKPYDNKAVGTRGLDMARLAVILAFWIA